MFNPLDHPVCYSQPLRLVPTDTISFVPVAMFLVDILRPKVVIELGTREGVIFSAYCQAVSSLGFKALCYAVGDFEASSSPASLNAGDESLRRHHEIHYREISRLLTAPTDEVARSFEAGTVDLLHLRDCQTYAGAKLTLETWMPKMSPGGVIVFNYINDHSEGHDVWKIWNELKPQYKSFEFKEDGGLGLLIVGGDPPASLSEFLPTSDREAALIREFFHQHGRRLKAQIERDEFSRRFYETHHQLEETLRRLEETGRRLSISQKHEEYLLKELDLSGLKVEALTAELETSQTQLQAILNSRAWRWVSRYGRVKRQYAVPAYRLIRPKSSNGHDQRPFDPPVPIDPYEAWLEVNRWNSRRESLIQEALSGLRRRPIVTIQIRVPVSRLEYLRPTIDSVRNQVYQHWELEIAVDQRIDPDELSALKLWTKRDSRIHVHEPLSEVTCAASQGEYVLSLAAGDQLSPNALAQVALSLDANPGAAMLYFDYDWIDKQGRRSDPQCLSDSVTELPTFVVRSRELSRDPDTVGDDWLRKLRAENRIISYLPEILAHQYSDSAATKESSQAVGPNREQNCLPTLFSSARTSAPKNLKPIRALMCAFNLNLEGAPHSQYELTVRLKEKGVIDPIVYSPTDGALRESYERRGIPVKVRRHPLLGVTQVVEYERKIQTFASWLGEWNIDLVYGNTLQTFYAIEAAHALNLPAIWNLRESHAWQTYFDFLPADVAKRALECFCYPYQIVFVARATQACWEPLNSRHNFTVIHNGLNRVRFDTALREWPRTYARKHLGASERELVVLLLGTVCERKGQIDLVEAVRELTDQTADRAKFFIVGDRPNDYGEQLKKTLLRLPSARRSRCELVPETADVGLFYSAADIFVCTSRLESFPRVILEAMAARLPIITTPVFGIAEQVEPNVSALFYEPGDIPALAEALTRLIDDPKLRRKLAVNAEAALDRLIDFETMVDLYGQLFREAWLHGASRNPAESTMPA